MSTKKKRRGFVIIGILLFLIVVLPLIMAGLSFIGRIDPDSVMPDSFYLYASVPDPARLAGRILRHEALPDIMELAELAPLMASFDQVQRSGLTDNALVRFVSRGMLKAALLPDDKLLAVWDAGIVSPLLRFLPALAPFITVPSLYYVQAGRNSRFEYRLDDGTVFFIAPYKNVLVISNNSPLFQSVLDGTSRTGDTIGANAKTFHSKDHDAAFLLSQEVLVSSLSSGDAQALSALSMLNFTGSVEVSLSVLPKQIKLRIVTPLGTDNHSLQTLIGRNSRSAPLLASIPSNAQYLTLLSAGSLAELLNGASAIGGQEFSTNINRADSGARTLFRMSLDELLFSWTGTQFAVFGIEGRPNPVFAIEISDEAKRKEVFDRTFSSIFVTEDIRLNLDGNRIPQIRLPAFLNSLLSLLGVEIPSPYYVVQNNYVLLSESPEALLSAVHSIRRNEVLPREALWRTLAESNSGPSSFTLFYSLDRSLPFFLRGNSEVTAILRLYRQGLAQLVFENNLLTVSFSAIPGEGRGIRSAPGFPLDLAGGGTERAANRLYSIGSGRGARNTRLLSSRGRDVLAINPADRSIRELSGFASPGTGLYAIPQAGGEGEAWVVDTQGNVSLVNRDLENLSGFPINTGIRLSAQPKAWGGKVYLSAEDGAVYTIDSKASISQWAEFSAPLRSAPEFLNFANRTYVAVYPKDIMFQEIFLLDEGASATPQWSFEISGNAYGSPLLFSARHGGRQEQLFAAFITQRGELTVHSNNGDLLPGFPLSLDGVFYLQPVFDGQNLWIIEAAGVLYRINLNGEIFSQRIPRFTAREDGYIAVVDGEVFFSGEGNALHGYTHDFHSLAGFPLPIWGRPIIADIDGDGKREIAGISLDNKLHVWQFR